MKINMIGQRNLLGYGTFFANLCDQMKRLSFLSTLITEYSVYGDSQTAEKLVADSSPKDINIWFSGFLDPKLFKTKGRNVVLAMFEHDKLATNYVKRLSFGDLVWAPSAWAKNVLVTHGLPATKIAVIPGGVDSEIYHPHCRQWLETQTPGKFRFLMLGKFEERKGYKQLLDAFVKAFGKNPKVELLIKGDYYIDMERKAALLLDFVKSYNAPNIRLLTGAGSPEDLFVIYNMADAFVFPSRGEGWGLPLIEAMATGLPTIATNHSGQTEFLSQLGGLFMPVAHKLVPIDDPEFKQLVESNNGDWGHWAEADVDDLAEKMQNLMKNHQLWRRNAHLASQVLRTSFSWANSAHIMVESLLNSGLLPHVRFNTPHRITMN